MRIASGVLFAASILLLAWLWMSALHEAGHVLGAAATGGVVQEISLPAFGISRTDVSPNPRPLIVVWSGPIGGCLLAVLAGLSAPGRFRLFSGCMRFFAGFCLIANGSYIAFGAFERIGDCGVMLNNGTPVWALWLFGAVAIPSGFLTWHRMGSLEQLVKQLAKITPAAAAIAIFLCLASSWLLSLV